MCWMRVGPRIPWIPYFIRRAIFRKTRARKMDLCIICRDDFENGEKICRIKRCEHDFHKKCLFGWIKTRGPNPDYVDCPVCRRRIRPGPLLAPRIGKPANLRAW